MKLNNSEFRSKLLLLVSSPFKEQDSGPLVQVALSVWYGDTLLLQAFGDLAQSQQADELYKKKALYVLDTLRRYQCTNTEKKNLANQILSANHKYKRAPLDQSLEQKV